MILGYDHDFCCFWCRQVLEQPIQIVQLNGCLVKMLSWYYCSM